jgi:hypothetical protein
MGKIFYKGLNELEMARIYLYRCIDISENLGYVAGEALYERAKVQFAEVTKQQAKEKKEQDD